MTDKVPARVILLALGNGERGDDQFGLQLLRRFLRHYAMPPQLQWIEGGIRPMALYPELVGCQWLILLDAVQTDQPGPEIITRDPLPLPAPDSRIAVHQMGITELLQLMAVLGELPERISLIGAPVHALTPGASLSLALEPRLPEACKALAALLQDHGMAVRSLKVVDPPKAASMPSQSAAHSSTREES